MIVSHPRLPVGSEGSQIGRIHRGMQDEVGHRAGRQCSQHGAGLSQPIVGIFQIHHMKIIEERQSPDLAFTQDLYQRLLLRGNADHQY